MKPPRGQDGGAARAGAADSLEDAAVIDMTAIMKRLPMTPAELVMKAQDMEWFDEHPRALSRARDYHPGEMHPLLILANGGTEPEAVAIAPIQRGEHARVILWPGMLRATGRILVEKAARRERKRRGLPVIR